MDLGPGPALIISEYGLSQTFVELSLCLLLREHLFLEFGFV